MAKKICGIFHFARARRGNKIGRTNPAKMVRKKAHTSTRSTQIRLSCKFRERQIGKTNLSAFFAHTQSITHIVERCMYDIVWADTRVCRASNKCNRFYIYMGRFEWRHCVTIYQTPNTLSCSISLSIRAYACLCMYVYLSPCHFDYQMANFAVSWLGCLCFFHVGKSELNTQ